MKKTVRTRFAPSPTGFLHIGGVRTALYSYAWAKKHGGIFILRLEDTDQKRFVPEGVEQIIRSLQWAGIVPDEGLVDVVDGQPVQKGEHGSYIQSQRIALYQEFAQRLLNEKKAYRCYCTSERLEEMRTVQMAAKQMPKYDRLCLSLTGPEIEAHQKAQTPFVIRFRVPEGGPVSWNDAVFGTVTFARDQIDDFVMIKADGFPTYNFANVVDDHTMQITHVVRAQEFLSSTPKHLLLYEAFGVSAPEYAHASHILGKDKKKLSKRHAAVSTDEYKKAGYLPQALVNFIALLGWTHPEQKELFSMDEFIQAFDVKAMHKAGAVFDTEKSLWMNGQYIRQLSIEAFADACIPFLVESGLLDVQGKEKYTNSLSKNNLSREQLQAILASEQARVKQLSEISEAVRFYFEPSLRYDKSILVWKKGKAEDLLPILNEVHQALSDLAPADWRPEAIQNALQALVERSGRGVGDVFWPLRVAITGRERSPSPQDVAAILGKDMTLARIKSAVDLVQS